MACEEAEPEKQQYKEITVQKQPFSLFFTGNVFDQFVLFTYESTVRDNAERQ